MHRAERLLAWSVRGSVRGLRCKELTGPYWISGKYYWHYFWLNTCVFEGLHTLENSPSLPEAVPLWRCMYFMVIENGHGSLIPPKMRQSHQDFGFSWLLLPKIHKSCSASCDIFRHDILAILIQVYILIQGVCVCDWLYWGGTARRALECEGPFSAACSFYSLLNWAVIFKRWNMSYLDFFNLESEFNSSGTFCQLQRICGTNWNVCRAPIVQTSVMSSCAAASLNGCILYNE